MNPINAENVSFQYKTGENLALKNINLKISAGKFVLLCGPTGSGKTSLIRSINGLIPHFYHGSFYGYMKVNDFDTCEAEIENIAAQVGTVFQSPENQLFSMDVERELAFGLENLGFDRKIIEKRIEEVFQIVKIEHLRHRPPFDLSGGEQQKVAIASLLAMKPEILVLDEPLSNLDPKSACDVVNLLKTLQKTHNKTIIISEHRLEYILPYIDEVVIVKQGEIIQHDNITTIINGDLFYSIGLDIPPLLYWFKKMHVEKKYSGKIPLRFSDKLDMIRLIYTNNLRKKIKPQSLENKNLKILTPNQEFNNSSRRIPKIVLNNISFSYKSKEIDQSVLKEVSLQIFPGEIIGIVGPNGAGKSTFIRCLNGLLRPQSGEIWINNQNIVDIPIYELAKSIGIMFQNPDHQLFSNSVEEELKFSLKNLKLSKNEEEERIDSTLQQLDIIDLKDKSPFSISGGQKKKVSIASILVRKPSIIIFDEPTIGQDALQKKNLEKIVQLAHQQNSIVIIISHDLEFISQLATRVLVLKDGEILTEGTSNEIFTNEYIINAAHLEHSELNQIIQKIHQDFPEIPTNILLIKDLEEVID